MIWTIASLPFWLLGLIWAIIGLIGLVLSMASALSGHQSAVMLLSATVFLAFSGASFLIAAKVAS